MIEILLSKLMWRQLFPPRLYVYTYFSLFKEICRAQTEKKSDVIFGMYFVVKSHSFHHTLCRFDMRKVCFPTNSSSIFFCKIQKITKIMRLCRKHGKNNTSPWKQHYFLHIGMIFFLNLFICQWWCDLWICSTSASAVCANYVQYNVMDIWKW